MYLFVINLAFPFVLAHRVWYEFVGHSEEMLVERGIGGYSYECSVVVIHVIIPCACESQQSHSKGCFRLVLMLY